jgi:metal-responsive CopG/Arc/MetJ family transcriptional regulator
MKTAISIPDEVFEQAEQAAKRLGLSRSELFTRAVQAFLATRLERNITASYDAAFEGSSPIESDAFHVEATRRALSNVEWED